MGRVITWDEGFDVGVQKMNDEHKIIISMIGDLVNQYEEKGDFDKVLQTLTDLGEYTTKHFMDEEAYMESIGYPELSTHKIIHKKLLTDFSNYALEIQKTKTISDAFINFLNMWLTAHIKGIDMKYNPNRLKNAS